MVLTTEELLFINKRVTDTRELVFLLHDKCMKVRESIEIQYKTLKFRLTIGHFPINLKKSPNLLFLIN